MGISNDAQEDVDEFGAASAELKQFPWDQKFIAWEAEARYDLEFRIGSLEQEVYALRRENADLRAHAERAEQMVGLKMSPNGRSVRTVSNWEKTMKEWDDSVPDGIKYLSAEKQVLMRRVRELESENARLKDAQRWIPVSERLPEEKQKILITWAPKYSQLFPAIFGEGFTDWTFTHWMPLPEPPEVQE